MSALAVVVGAACAGDVPGSKSWSHTVRADNQERFAQFVGAAERYGAALESQGFRAVGRSSNSYGGPGDAAWERVEVMYRGRVQHLQEVRVTIATLDRFVREQPAVEVRVQARVHATVDSEAAWESLRESTRTAILGDR